MQFLKNTANKIQYNIKAYDMDNKIKSLRMGISIESAKALTWIKLLKFISTNESFTKNLEPKQINELSKFAEKLDEKYTQLDTFIKELWQDERNLVQINRKNETIYDIMKTKRFYSALFEKVQVLQTETKIIAKEFETITGVHPSKVVPVFK